MTPRNLMISALLLILAGCGCNDDSTPPGNVTPARIPAVLGIKTLAPAIPVPPPQVQTTPFKIDVTFVLDDSDNMNNKVLGVIPSNQGDLRTRTQAAQAIMRNLRTTVEQRVAQEWAQRNPGVPVPPLDFAFAVARYEDFGGDFTDMERRAGPIDSSTNDMDARPFILNMPILREKHPQFATRFLAAMSREAPGDGNPLFNLGGDLYRAVDPQTAIEALYQIAAPQNQDGSYGGFDGNSDGDTSDSGQPTSENAGLNPQTAPGASGDVPAIKFLDVGLDADGRPLFQVADAAGTPVTIPDAVGAQVPSYASGNIGGAGWRPDAARFVVLSSDIATVAPTETEPQGTPENLSNLPPPAPTEMITSTDGGAQAPREARSVLLGAFDAAPLPGLKVTERRTGVADGPDFDPNLNDNVRSPGTGVAPIGAHTVQQAIARLNALNIEVLLLGAPQAGGLDTKPGVTGVNGDIDSDIDSDSYDPTDATKVAPEIAPWFWFNAVSTLTTPPITSIPMPGRVTPSLFGGDSNLFWGTYNLGTVWPFKLLDPAGTDETNIRPVVVDDLAERIFDWVDNGYITGGVANPTRPALPTVFYSFTLELVTPEVASDLVQVQPLSSGSPITLFTQVVQIPTYWSDEANPGATTVSFPLPAQNPITYNTIDDTIVLPAQDTFAFRVSAELQSIGNQIVDPAPNPNTAQVAAITTFIVRRGDGFTTGMGGGVQELLSPFDPIVQAEAAYTVTVRDSRFPGPGSQLATVVRGCAVLNDLTLGQDSSDQVGGTCPFPPPPMPVFLKPSN